MSLWSRIINVVRGDRLNREIDEELESHIEEAVEQGRDPAEVRRAFGSALRHREASRDAKLIRWLESLLADAIFGLRQLKKSRITSAAAILSLALAIGACISAFRLLDALLLRPLPVAGADRLYIASRQGLSFNGIPGTFDGTEYPLFQLMQATVKDQAEVIAVSWDRRVDLTYASDQEMFVTSFDRLSHQSTGFSAERLLTLDTVTKSPQAPAFWDQVAGHLRTVPGVEKVALAGWPLLDGNGWNGFVSANGAPPSPVLAYFLSVSPGWAESDA